MKCTKKIQHPKETKRKGRKPPTSERRYKMKTTVKIKNKKEFTEKVREYRQKGYNIITYCKMFAEMEKGDEIITIEK